MPLYRKAGKIVHFVHIPKCGGTSIERALRQSGCAEALRSWDRVKFSEVNLQHMHRDYYLRAVGKGFADYTFAVVRNPYTRMASEYRMKAVGKDAESIQPDHWISRAIERYGQRVTTRDNHIRPQVDFLGGEVEVFRLEDGLDAAVKKAADVLNLDGLVIGHERASPTTNLLSISGRTLEEIQRVYASDFRELGYNIAMPEVAFDVTG